MSVTTVGSMFVDGCAGGLFKFELPVFGTAGNFGAGMSRGGEMAI